MVIKRLTNPMAKASLISKFFTFWWLNDTFKKGYKHPLENADVFQVLPEDESKMLTDRLENLWNEEVQDAKRKNRKPRLRNAFIKFLGFYYLFLAAPVLLEEGCKIFTPLLIARLIMFFNPVPGISKTDAYITGVGLSLISLIMAVFHAPAYFLPTRCGVHLRIAAGSLVYRKALRLSQAALSKTTTGQIVNLMTSDIHRLEMVPKFFHFIWIAPLAVVVVTVLCWREIGLAVLPGVFLFVLLVPLQGFIGRCFARLRAKTAVLSDKRIKVMNEIISGMRVIKMYTWERPFAKIVAQVRRQETKLIKFSSFFRAVNGALFFSALPLVYLVVFTTFVMTGHTLTVERLFVVLGLFFSVRDCTTVFFSVSVMYLKEGSVSEKRLQRFLELEERPTPLSVELNSTDSNVEAPMVQLTNIIAYWDQSLSPALKEVTFEAKQCELHVVIGPVGSGKSSLLMALLGELPIYSGERKVSGTIGYACQQPWIFSGTVKENILFGKEFVKERYLKVLEACALQRDLELFNDGDSSLVGERGVVLSGGQKARISLARAVYNNADIYLLDDPLSAVDTNVGRELFDKCILGLLKEKVCVLVTHQLQYLTDATSILCLKEGSCVGRGTFSELSMSGLDVKSLITIPETDTDSALEADDVDLEEKDLDSCSRETTTVKTVQASTREQTMEKEDRSRGNITWKIYIDYWKAGAGVIKILLLVLFLLGAQASSVACDLWLAQW